MIRSFHLLTLALGAILSTGVADAGEHAPFAEGLFHLGSSVRDARHQQNHRDAGSPVVHADLDDANGNNSRVEQTLGAISVEYIVPERVPEHDPGDVARTAPREVPEANVPGETGVVPLETMLDGEDLGIRDRVHEFLTRRPPTEQDPEVDTEGVIAADFLTDESDAAATVQLSDDQLPPPPPPSAGPTEGPEPPEPAAPMPAMESPPTLPSAPVSTGFIDPRYQLSAESSIYTWTCERCGRLHCHCVYAPFGEAMRSAFGQQIHLGSAELMTLYAYDFHSERTPLQSRLTTRGEYQLDKIVRRLQFTPAPIRIQATGNDALDAARRIRVLEALGDRGIADADGLVVTVRTGAGRPAIELLESSNGLLESIRERGRTIKDVGGARFGQ